MYRFKLVHLDGGEIKKDEVLILRGGNPKS
jgi:hypothetical protein